MANLPKNFFGKTWSIDTYGKITECEVLEATQEKITVKSYWSDGSPTSDVYVFNGKTNTWECYSRVLVFDIHSDEAQQLINDRIIKRAQDVENSYRKAFDRYLTDMKEIVAIKESNLKFK